MWCWETSFLLGNFRTLDRLGPLFITQVSLIKGCMHCSMSRDHYTMGTKLFGTSDNMFCDNCQGIHLHI